MFYIDVRAMGKHEDFYTKVQDQTYYDQREGWRDY